MTERKRIASAEGSQPLASQSAASTVRNNESGDFAEHIHRAAMCMAQAKLHLRRGIRILPDNKPHARRILEALAAAQQFAIESTQQLGVFQ